MATDYGHGQTNIDHETGFPINRRHQGLATRMPLPKWHAKHRRQRFQSIGVTKDWRLTTYPRSINGQSPLFPINRRHQGLATCSELEIVKIIPKPFPINRRHQGLATYSAASFAIEPIEPGFQSIGVTKDWRPSSLGQIPPRPRPRVSNQ